MRSPISACARSPPSARRKLAGKRPPKKRELVSHLLEDWLKACDAKVRTR
jgi:hypothetical protein